MPDSVPLRGSAYHPAGGTRPGHRPILRTSDGRVPPAASQRSGTESAWSPPSRGRRTARHCDDAASQREASPSSTALRTRKGLPSSRRSRSEPASNPARSPSHPGRLKAASNRRETTERQLVCVESVRSPRWRSDCRATTDRRDAVPRYTDDDATHELTLGSFSAVLAVGERQDEMAIAPGSTRAPSVIVLMTEVPFVSGAPVDDGRLRVGMQRRRNGGARPTASRRGRSCPTPFRCAAAHTIQPGGRVPAIDTIRKLDDAELHADAGVTLMLRERRSGPTTAQSLAWLQSLPEPSRASPRHRAADCAARVRHRRPGSCGAWATSTGLQVTARRPGHATSDAAWKYRTARTRVRGRPGAFRGSARTAAASSIAAIGTGASSRAPRRHRRGRLRTG